MVIQLHARLVSFLLGNRDESAIGRKVSQRRIDSVDCQVVSVSIGDRPFIERPEITPLVADGNSLRPVVLVSYVIMVFTPCVHTTKDGVDSRVGLPRDRHLLISRNSQFPLMASARNRSARCKGAVPDIPDFPAVAPNDRDSFSPSVFVDVGFGSPYDSQHSESLSQMLVAHRLPPSSSSRAASRTSCHPTTSFTSIFTS